MGYNSILDRLVEKYPNAEGIDDARNIAEAVAAINGVGGRGANAIADQFPAIEEETEPAGDETEPTENGNGTGTEEPGDSLLDPEPSEP